MRRSDDTEEGWCKVLSVDPTEARNAEVKVLVGFRSPASQQ
jgi:hypothetical protein